MNVQMTGWGTWSDNQYKLEDIEAALNQAEAAAGGNSLSGQNRPPRRVGLNNIVLLPGAPVSAFTRTTRGMPMTANARADLPDRQWVERLSVADMDALAQFIANHPAMRSLADAERSAWLRVLFGFAALGAASAAGACEAARAWSKTSSRYRSDADFDRDWASFDPNRPNGITVGTLVHEAEAAGVDLHPWRDLAGFSTTPPTTTGSSATPFFSPVPFDAAHLHPVSWLVLGLLLRGETTVLSGQGGGAKTALAVHIAVALAAGRSRVGATLIKPNPAGFRIAFISGEEDQNRLGLLIAAACEVSNLSMSERACVARNLEMHDAQASGWRLGQPRDNRETIAPENDDQCLIELSAALQGFDVLILDNLSALFAHPSENDNPILTTLMRRLTSAARMANCAVLLLHHTPKMTREAAAALRGDPTLVRGGSAITNSARVVLTLTALKEAEQASFVIQGIPGNLVRRLEHAKINDIPPMDPVFLMTVPVPVKVSDGSEQDVRAVEFVQVPANSGVTDAVRNVVMKAIDAGVRDKHGTRVPLCDAGNTPRAAVPAITKELQHANSALTEPQAKFLGKEALKDLKERIGCIVDEEVRLPQYHKDGRSNGTQLGRGLVTRWHLAPWHDVTNAPPLPGALHDEAAAAAPEHAKTLSEEPAGGSPQPSARTPPYSEGSAAPEQPDIIPDRAKAEELDANADTRIE